jgi:hypothetical protein
MRFPCTVLMGPEFIAHDDIRTHRVHHVLLIVDADTEHTTLLTAYAPTIIVHYDPIDTSKWAAHACFDMESSGLLAHMRAQSSLWDVIRGLWRS